MSRQGQGSLVPSDDNIAPSILFPSPTSASASASAYSPSGSCLHLTLEMSAQDIALRREFGVFLEEAPGVLVQQVPQVSVEEAAGISTNKYEGSLDVESFVGQDQAFDNPSTGNYLSADIAETAGVPLSSELSVFLSSEPSLSSSCKFDVALSSRLHASINTLPTEIIERVFIIFIEQKCPLLWSLFGTGRIPLNSERGGLHVNSSLIQQKLQEEHASILPLLRISGYFYSIISRLLSHREVYINGIRSFNQLTLFEQRRAGGFFVIKKTPVIENMFRKEGEPYTPEMKQGQRSFRGSPLGIRPYRSTRPMRYRSYDRTGSGTGWRTPETNSDDFWAPKGWDMFPSWLTGGSNPSGLYLFDSDADEIIDPILMKHVKTLVIGADDPPHSPMEESDPLDRNFVTPEHLMFKVFNALSKASILKRLVISGSIFRNACWLAPKAVGEYHPLTHLTHLTLSLSENPSKFDSPLLCLQQYMETPDECHICNLLTGMNGHDGQTTHVPFLATLRHLHIRGPGAHVCANLFNADWEALENVVIEMGTHRGICDGELLKLLYAIDNAARNRLQMAIEITVRVCEPEFEKNVFGHHWWRTTPDTVPTLEQSTGIGEKIVLVKKTPGPASPVYATSLQLDRLDQMIETEWTRAMLAVSKIAATGGFDPLAMMYFDNDVCRIAEQEEMDKPEPQDSDPILIDKNRMLELRARADYDWLRSSRPLFPRFWITED